MFTNEKRQTERTGKHGTPRQQHLQDIVTQFQNPTTAGPTKEKLVANLANFAYDPYNYPHLRNLNVLELFLDCLSEPNHRLVEFAAGGVCNAAADPENAKLIAGCGGVAALVGCLSSPVRNTVKYAVGGLFYLCEWEVCGCDVEEVRKVEVVDLLTKFAEGGGGGGGGGDCVGVRNLARVLLDKHLLKKL